MSLLDHAREMRRDPTKAEQRLWSWLRLAIEVDGKHHEQAGMTDYDDERTSYLNSLSIEVVRIANETILRQPAIAEDILGWSITGRR